MNPADELLFGHSFSGRYKALVVDGSGNGIPREGCDQVHPKLIEKN